MAIGLSHGGTTIYTSPHRSNEVLVGTLKGVARIERSGGSGWRVTDHSLGDKHISAIIAEPESGLIFAGAFHGSIHASSDGGKTWGERSKGLTEDNVYSLASIKQDGRTRIYAGTEPAHCFYSDDLGEHWSEYPGLSAVPGTDKWTFPGPPHVAHLKHFNFDPTNPKTVYASIEVGALLKSTDAGQSWRVIEGMYEDVHRTVINPEDSRRIYVTGGNGLYMTADGGANWEHLTETDNEIGGYPDGLVFLPRQPQLMFISSAKGSPGSWRETCFAGARISRSRDGGRTWEILRNGLPDRLQSSIEALALEDYGSGFSIFAGTTAGEVYVSDDGGESWSQAISGLAPISKSGHYRALVAA